MHTTAIILAGGRGSRMNTDVPKQYIDVFGEPLLYYTIKSFEESDADDLVLVVGDSKLLVREQSAVKALTGDIGGKKWDCDETGIKDSEPDGRAVSEMEFCRGLIMRHGFKKVRACVLGGSERYNSVMNGLAAADSGTDAVLVHDGARPCITAELINRCIADVSAYGSSVLAVPAKDTVKVVGTDGYVVDTPDRSTLWQIQTPQGFLYSELADCYDKLSSYLKCGKTQSITDDSMVMEKFGARRIHVTMGAYTNIKVTTIDDLEILKIFIKRC